MNVALAAAVGLMLAAGIVFLVEYLDDTLKTPEDVERSLGIPVLGFVAEMQYKDKSAEEVYVSRQPRSPVSEAFRSLRTNLEFASVQKPIQTFLVTSPGPSEGKTTVAVNLAAIFALSGKRVALIDADMRRPCVHRLLGLPNRDGLSSLFRSQESTQHVSRTKLDIPHLSVITSGSLPPNPAELLGSDRMGQILDELRHLVDVIVIDTPPSLVADAQILSGKVDGVLLVIQPGTTHAEAARASLELFKRAGARVIGTVLNRIPRNRDYYYGGYKYYSPYNNSKGYYTSTVESVTTPVPKTEPVQVEPVTTYTFLSRFSKSTPGPQELPPPDPPKQ
jgi:capsular exopolysaccharide synthesis family protein